MNIAVRKTAAMVLKRSPAESALDKIYIDKIIGTTAPPAFMVSKGSNIVTSKTSNDQ